MQPAQTNVQLEQQLRALGWAPEQCESARRAYALATQLLSGWYRGSGKPFVCHLVGTASVLAQNGGGTPIVVAGLMHAAYASGDFGDRSSGVTLRKRAQVRSVIGEAAESLVCAYAGYPWTLRGMKELAGRVGSLDTAERAVVAMRIANEVDDGNEDGERLAACAVIARELDWPATAAWLAACAARADMRSEPYQRRGSYFLAPQTYALRPSLQIRNAIARVPLARRARDLARTVLRKAVG